MRIKRQRRKLRGKYSGNCLSCAAKWSKCWYIASVDNQREWETRLNKVVTPCDDEVCFQCWDAKIRTSPKRKIHYKSELPAIYDPESPENTSTDSRPSRRVERNKRRALNSDFDYTADDFTPTPPPPKRSRANPLRATRSTFEGYSIPEEGEDEKEEEEEEEEPYQNLSDESDDSATGIYEESIIFGEENAVILLSTAFRTIPHHMGDLNINIAINTFVGDSDDDKAKRRGAYYCGRCGKLKKGHMCDVPSTTQSPDPCTLSPDSTPLSPNLPTNQHLPTNTIITTPMTTSHSITSLLSSIDVIAALAQPVIS